jgi:cobalamin biosynthetic protein CobC
VTVFFDKTEHAADVHEALAEQAVLTRLGDNRHWLRFGLPGDAPAAARLVAALEVVGERGLC